MVRRLCLMLEVDRCLLGWELTVRLFILKKRDLAIITHRRLLLELEGGVFRVGLGDGDAFAEGFDRRAFVAGAEGCAVEFGIVRFEDEVERLGVDEASVGG